jgi:hypothetical protein
MRHIAHVFKGLILALCMAHTSYAEDSWVLFSRKIINDEISSVSSLLKESPENYEKVVKKYLVDGDREVVVDFFKNHGVPRENVPELNEISRLMLKCSVDGILASEQAILAREKEWENDLLTTSLVHLYYFHRTGDFSHLGDSLSSEMGDMSLEYLGFPAGMHYDRNKLMSTILSSLHEIAAKKAHGKIDLYRSHSMLTDYRKWIIFFKRKIIDEEHAVTLMRMLDEIAGDGIMSSFLGEYYRETISMTDDYTRLTRKRLVVYLVTASKFAVQKAIAPTSQKWVSDNYLTINEFSAVGKLLGR